LFSRERKQAHEPRLGEANVRGQFADLLKEEEEEEEDEDEALFNQVRVISRFRIRE
jgi:hypothetical protein